MKQLTDTHGGVPQLFVHNTGGQLIGYDLGQLSQSPQIVNKVNQYRVMTGQDPIDAQTFRQIPPQNKKDLISQALSFGTEVPTKANAVELAQKYQNYADAYRKNQDAISRFRRSSTTPRSITQICQPASTDTKLNRLERFRLRKRRLRWRTSRAVVIRILWLLRLRWT